MRMTRADKFEEVFGYRPATNQVLCNEHDWCGENDVCNYCMCNPNSIGREEDWWSAEYKEPTRIDCIDRNSIKYYPGQGGYMYASKGEIDKLPSITPQEPKTGHWIKCCIPRCGEQHYQCTNCEEYFNFGLYSDYYKKAFKFCPNCGADMREVEE